MAIPAALVNPLADALGDAFETPELDGILLACTGARLFKEWVPEGDPHRVTAYKLLMRLQEEGRDTAFLAHVLARRAGPEHAALRKTIEEACPGARDAVITIRDQLAPVLRGLDAVRARLADPPVRAALAESRAALERVADNIDLLALYKNLHECLHQLQMRAFQGLRTAAKQFPGNNDKLEYLREYEEMVNTCVTKALGWIDGRSPGSRECAVESEWIDTLRGAVGRYDPALGAKNVAAMLAVLNDVHRALRQEPPRLSREIYLAAKNLPLEDLTQALRKVAEAAGPEQPALADAHKAMHDLRGALLGRVVEHRTWQQADGKIWDLEATFEQPPAEAREEFILIWAEAKSAVRNLALLSPGAAWSKSTEAQAARIDDELVAEPPGPGFKDAFDAYRRQARFRFFEVDAELRKDCAALVRIGEPLHRILEDLRNDPIH